MRMRAYIILIFTAFVSCEVINAQWTTQHCPTKNNLNAVFFKNINSGWVAGDSGTIVRKSLNGWVGQEIPTRENLNSIFMVEVNDGWAVGAHGTILHYNGTSWQIYDSPTRNNLYSVSFKDSRNGIAVGESGTILSYENGVWRLIGSGTRGRLFASSYIKDNIWVGGGLECVKVPVMKIGLNNKEKPVIKSFDSNASISSLIFLSPGNGWAVGSPHTINHFDGAQWDRIDINEDYPALASVFFSDENNGISVGYEGTILIYKDGRWTKEASLSKKDLRGCYISGNDFYAVGKSGTILIRSMAQSRVKNLNDRNTEEKIRLYPDPCDGILNIIMPAEISAAKVRFSVSNATGQVLKQKVYPGSNISYSLVTSDLKEGFYYLKVEEGSNISSIKFVVRH